MKTIFAAVCALSVMACSGAAERGATQKETMGEASSSEAMSGAAKTENTEVFEVCDGEGNRYPSEAAAETAGLDRAEYGATFCDYLE